MISLSLGAILVIVESEDPLELEMQVQGVFKSMANELFTSGKEDRKLSWGNAFVGNSEVLGAMVAFVILRLPYYTMLCLQISFIVYQS